MSGIELRPDVPHSDDYTAEVARLLAESVRVLNYATGPHADRGLTYPQTVYDVAGALAAGAAGLGQTLGQLAAFLEVGIAEERLADDGGAPAARVARADAHLIQARAAAAELARALAEVQNATRGLYLPDPGDETEV